MNVTEEREIASDVALTSETPEVVMNGFTLGRDIRELRRAKNWSLGMLASKANVDKSVLSRIERGETTRPHEATLEQIATALEINLGMLSRPRQKPEIEGEILRSIEGMLADGDDLPLRALQIADEILRTIEEYTSDERVQFQARQYLKIVEAAPRFRAAK